MMDCTKNTWFSFMQFPFQSIACILIDSKSMVGARDFCFGREAMQIVELHPQLRKLHLLGARETGANKKKHEVSHNFNTRFEGIKGWRKFKEELIPTKVGEFTYICYAFLCVHWVEIWLESWVYFGSFPGCWRFRFGEGLDEEVVPMPGGNQTISSARLYQLHLLLAAWKRDLYWEDLGGTESGWS